MTLDFIVTNQTLVKHKSQEKQNVVGESRNYLKANFIFQSQEWKSGEPIYALFTYNGQTWGKILGTEPNVGANECYVPPEVIHSPSFLVSCYCGDRITTNEVKVDIAKSGYTDIIVNTEPTVSMQEYYDRRFKQYAAIFNSMLKDMVELANGEADNDEV